MDCIQTENKSVDLFGAGKHGFKPGDKAAGVLATFVSPEWSNGVQEEILNVIRDAGLVPSGADLTQLDQAIRRLVFGYVGNAAGTPDAITADFTPDVAALTHGMTVHLKATGANTVNAPTFAPDAIAAKAIVKGSNQVLAAGDIPGAGYWIALRYDSAIDKWVLLNPGVGRLLGVQVFTASGTYTATPGTTRIKVDVLGGGGAGGGAQATAAGQVAAGGGGNAGSYGSSLLQGNFTGTAITVGGGGGGVAGSNGGAGGTSSFGASISAPGGSGGAVGVATAPPSSTTGAPVSTNASGANIITSPGQSGGSAVYASTSAFFSGVGGMSAFGAGGAPVGTGNFNGNAASGRGAGGSGACSGASNASAQTGGSGAGGLVLVWEYS